MLVMGIASVLVIREFHVEYRLTANNYLFFLSNPLYLSLLIRSIVIAIAVTLICLILAFPFAYLLTLMPRHVQRVMTVLVILPFWTSYLLRVYAWMTILGERGLINRALVGVGILDEPVIPVVQQLCRRDRISLSLYPLLRAGALHGAGASRYVAVQCRDGSWRTATPGLLARHAAAWPCQACLRPSSSSSFPWSANTSRRPSG